MLAEVDSLNEEADILEKEFNELNKLLVKAETSKNALLAFGTKYKFLIKKEDKEDLEHEHPHVHEEEVEHEEAEVVEETDLNL